MYVCLCKNITDNQIHKAINDGATCMRDLNNQVGGASQCGKCGLYARQMLRQACGQACPTPESE